MKKILHYTIGFHYPSRGGVETAIQDFASMTKEHAENYVMAKNASGSYPNLVGLKSVKNGGFSTHCTKYNNLFDGIPGKTMEFDDTTLNAIRNVNPDVLIVYPDCSSMMIPLGELDIPMKVIRIQGYHMLQKCPDAANYADRIIIFDSDIKKSFSDSNKSKVVTIPKSYNHHIFNSQGRKAIDTREMLYVGRYSQQKRTGQMIYVFQQLKQKYKNIHLTIIGGGTPSSYDIEIDKQIKKQPDGIVKRSWVNAEELAEEYRNHGVLVIPSKYETFSSVALEAFACGAIVVINSNGNTAWGKGERGICGWAKDMAINAFDGSYDNDGWPRMESLKNTLEELILGEIKYTDHSRTVENTYSYKNTRDRVIELFC